MLVEYQAYRADKIRNTHILQTNYDGKIERSLLVQFEDSIVRMGVDGSMADDELKSTANLAFDVICPKDEHIKLNMVRGVASKVFYAGKKGKSEKIYMANHGDQPN